MYDLRFWKIKHIEKTIEQCLCKKTWVTYTYHGKLSLVVFGYFNKLWKSIKIDDLTNHIMKLICCNAQFTLLIKIMISMFFLSNILLVLYSKFQWFDYIRIKYIKASNKEVI